MTGVSLELEKTLQEAVEEAVGSLDRGLIERAYQFSARAHHGQKRLSGEDYISHSVAVARILLEQGLDTVSVVAALLHDVAEDSDVSIEEIRSEFGSEVATIVDGLTKISNISFRSTVEKQGENYRKFLMSIARDARVIIVKLADRLHNMRTIEHQPAEKQERIALETQEIYAPFAHRFGMAGVKSELEDLAFKVLDPEDYDAILEKVDATQAEREKLIERLREPLAAELDAAGLEGYEITGRAKHLWSIHRKMVSRGKPFEEIFDLMAVRALVDSNAECYHVLGLVHSKWTHLHDRIKDYVSAPKSNAYQSLHTTIFGPGGHMYEIQIRTREMHRTAEYGIAAHWAYKDGTNPDERDSQFSWFQQLLDLDLDSLSPTEFLEFLKIDLFQDEIFVFTPMGDVKQLPKGATPIDFAFAVHTEVGFRCKGARVNGRISPLHRPLRNGETVEVITRNQQQPSRDWLNHVKTARARHKIRQWIRQEQSATSIALGKDLLNREVKRRRWNKLQDEAVQRAAESFDLGSVDGVYRAVGSGDLATGQVLKVLYPDQSAEQQPSKPSPIGRVIDRMRLGKGVRIQGVDGILVRYALCCQPVPGNKVIGFVTKGKGISIHRQDCPNLLTMSTDPHRRVEIDWQNTEGEVFDVRLAVVGEDRRGLYADLMAAVSETGTNIRRADLQTGDGTMSGTVLVEVENDSNLVKVLRAMRRIKGVTSVARYDQGEGVPGGGT